MSYSLRSRLAAIPAHWLAAAAVACFVLVLGRLLAAEESERTRVLAEQTQLLQESGVETDTAGLIKYLRGLSPAAAREAKIPQLVADLGDDKFDVRERASKELKTLGESARQALTAALKSKDLEVAWRAKHLLSELDSDGQVERQRARLAAALLLLQEHPSADAAETLLATLPLCADSGLCDAACTALWKSVDSSHAELLRGALKQEHQPTIAAAIVALELASGPDSIATIEPYLASAEPQFRLAAARALVDRQPRRTAGTLAELTQSANQEIAAAARGLLNAMTGHTEPKVYWIKWRDHDLPTAKLATLGNMRLDLNLGREGLHEKFTTGLGLLQYESNIGQTPRVEKGIVAIGGGDQPEGDQRIFITAQKLLGRPEFPDSLEVRARLAAERNNNFGWHLGMSLGRVKVLFHPGVAGGGFRIETVKEHEALLPNQEMGFTPQPGVMHDMTIVVRRTGNSASFEITIVDCKNAKNRFTWQAKIPLEKLGKLDRIGLERSGRAGGAAIFDEVELRLK